MINIQISHDTATGALEELRMIATALSGTHTTYVSDLSSAKIGAEMVETDKDTTVKPEPAKRGRKAAAEKTQPTPPADPTPEVAAQDAADEAAEQETATEQPADAGPPVTVDDLRSAAGTYARVFGMPAAQEDGAKLIAIEGVTALSKVPADQLAAVTQRFRDAIENNPFGRAKVA